MPITNHTKLYQAFGLFIESFRPYVVALLFNQHKDLWPAEFAIGLTYDQKKVWDQGLRNGSSPDALIDFQHLKSFAIKNKDLFSDDFGKETKNLPNWLGEIYEMRNKVAHFNNDIDEDDATKVWIHLKKIAKLTKMADLEIEISKLMANETASTPEQPVSKVEAQTHDQSLLKPWFFVATPHFDIKQGKIDESVFAANLAEVHLGNGREIYKNPETFFSKTYFTAGLKSVAKTVINGLNGNEAGENRVISLQTGFGGGKTHTLISIYHLVNWGKNASKSAYTSELLSYTGNPAFEKANIAVFTNTTNDPVQGREVSENITIHTIWGEIAYQLGGEEAYELIRKNDEKLISPKGKFKEILTQFSPSLILVDELADYCVAASGVKVGSSTLADQTISFMQEFTEAVSETSNCVAIVTLPASISEVANSQQGSTILNSLQQRVSRVAADTQPVAEDEIYEVIRRRLFEDIGDAAYIEKVVDAYMSYYNNHWTELPADATKAEYRTKLLKSYPFHPELIDIFKIKWASNNNFQRTRGVLRLLAAIVSDLWKRQQSLPGENALIHSGNIYLPNLDSLTSQLKKLNGNAYESVISADIVGETANAVKIDNAKPEYGKQNLTSSIATVILLNSFGAETTNRGISIPEIKLQLLSPNGYNHNSINGSLSDLENSAYFLYSANTANNTKKYWFHVKPNISMLINDAKQNVKPDEVYAEILSRLKTQLSGIVGFNTIVDPSEDLPEQQKPTVLVFRPQLTANHDGPIKSAKELIKTIATKKGNSDRIYRNTILFLLANESASGALNKEIVDYLACKAVQKDYSTTLEKDQVSELERRKKDASIAGDKALVTSYSTIHKYSSKNGIESLFVKEFKVSLKVQIDSNVLDLLKEEEWIIENVGFGLLRTNNLLPTPAQSILVKDVYEAFLRFDDKPMIKNQKAVSEALQRYCMNNEFCIAAGDGNHFTKYYLGENVPFFDVTEQTYWLVHKDLKPKEEEVIQPSGSPDSNSGMVSTGTSYNPSPITGSNVDEPSTTAIETEQIINQLVISGQVPIENYSQLFSSFINPLKNNDIKIEIKIVASSTANSKLTENSTEFKIAKESAKQLGLEIDVQ